MHQYTCTCKCDSIYSMSINIVVTIFSINVLSLGHPIGESLDLETSLGLPGEAVGGVISSIPLQGLYIEGN